MACDRIAGNHKLYYAPYGTTGAPTYLGQTGPEGIRMTRTIITDDVMSDELGGGIVDHVYRGENLQIEFVAQEVNKDIVQMFLHPWTNTYTAGVQTAARQEDYGVPGRLGCGVYGVLEAIPAAFSPAEAFTGGSAAGTSGVYPGTAATAPASGRQFKGIVVGDLTETLDTSARFVPVRFQCYPFTVSSVLKHWQWISAVSSSLSGW